MLRAVGRVPGIVRVLGGDLAVAQHVASTRGFDVSYLPGRRHIGYVAPVTRNAWIAP
jgi:hypothetical protein